MTRIGRSIAANARVAQSPIATYKDRAIMRRSSSKRSTTACGSSIINFADRHGPPGVVRQIAAPLVTPVIRHTRCRKRPVDQIVGGVQLALGFHAFPGDAHGVVVAADSTIYQALRPTHGLFVRAQRLRLQGESETCGCDSLGRLDFPMLVGGTHAESRSRVAPAAYRSGDADQ
jgi:hypothetical protein